MLNWSWKSARMSPERPSSLTRTKLTFGKGGRQQLHVRDLAGVADDLGRPREEPSEMRRVLQDAGALRPQRVQVVHQLGCSRGRCLLPSGCGVADGGDLGLDVQHAHEHAARPVRAAQQLEARGLRVAQRYHHLHLGRLSLGGCLIPAHPPSSRSRTDRDTFDAPLLLSMRRRGISFLQWPSMVGDPQWSGSAQWLQALLTHALEPSNVLHYPTRKPMVFQRQTSRTLQPRKTLLHAIPVTIVPSLCAR